MTLSASEVPLEYVRFTWTPFYMGIDMTTNPCPACEGKGYKTFMQVDVQVFDGEWKHFFSPDKAVFFEGFCPIHLCAFEPDGCQFHPAGFDGNVAPNCPRCDQHWRGRVRR